jgi:hypothetical protein
MSNSMLEDLIQAVADSKDQSFPKERVIALLEMAKVQLGRCQGDREAMIDALKFYSTGRPSPDDADSLALANEGRYNAAGVGRFSEQMAKSRAPSTNVPGRRSEDQW